MIIEIQVELEILRKQFKLVGEKAHTEYENAIMKLITLLNEYTLITRFKSFNHSTLCE